MLRGLIVTDSAGDLHPYPIKQKKASKKKTSPHQQISERILAKVFILL